LADFVAKVAHHADPNRILVLASLIRGIAFLAKLPQEMTF
jgi:hypothetical protein